MHPKLSKRLAALVVISASFIGINLYVSWLGSMIVPFDSQIDLTNNLSTQSFVMEGFYTAPYILAFEFALPSDVKKLGWEEKGRIINEHFDVEVDVTVKNVEGEELVKYVGNISELTYSNFNASPHTDEMLYLHQRLSAKLSETYELTLNVIKGSYLLSDYKPRLVLYGIDDGYFWLTRPLYNFLLLVLFSIIYAIYILISWHTNQKAKA